jgi:5-methylcytosine-specific restriction protein A
MAVTDGHGNPPWSREETILALGLYFAVDGDVPSVADHRVQALSQLLRTLPGHAQAGRRATFRNPDGVVFKLQNLRQVATGRGLANVSRMDRAIWTELGQSPDRVTQIGDAIVAAAAMLGSDVDLPSEEDEFQEGRLLTAMHFRRERAPKLRAKLLALRRKQGVLSCDACNVRPIAVGLEFEDAIFEAHHLLPLGVTGPTVTRLADLSLLCANCHRLIHRLIATHRRWIDVKELRRMLRSPDTASITKM